MAMEMAPELMPQGSQGRHGAGWITRSDRLQ
jgi:hypothetical protein